MCSLEFIIGWIFILSKSNYPIIITVVTSKTQTFQWPYSRHCQNNNLMIELLHTDEGDWATEMFVIMLVIGFSLEISSNPIL